MLSLDTVLVRSWSPAEWDTIDLANIAAVGPGGELYAQSYLAPGSVIKLSAAGEVVDRFGREGGGPGELAGGGLDIFVTDHDTVYVKDNSLRWSVFTTGGSFVRSVALGSGVPIASRACVLSDGSVVIATRLSPGGSVESLRRLAPDGKAVRDFGAPARAGGILTAPVERELSCGVREGVWAMPHPLEPGYIVEHWNTSGRLIMRVVREAAWFKAGSAQTREDVTRSPPHSTVRQVVEPQPGMLLTMIVNADSRWKPMDRAEQRAHLDTQLDVRYELLDLASGQMLASLLVDDPATLPNRPFLRNGSVYEIIPDEDGGARLVSYALRLHDRR